MHNNKLVCSRCLEEYEPYEGVRRFPGATLFNSLTLMSDTDKSETWNLCPRCIKSLLTFLTATPRSVTNMKPEQVYELSEVLLTYSLQMLQDAEECGEATKL